MSDAQEWRLQARLDGRDGLGELVRQLSGGEEVLGTRVGALPLGVDLTHDGDTLFAYASSRASVDGARSAIATALSAAGRSATWRVCCWDEELDEWRQVEPPLDDAARERDEARLLAARRHETRSFTCTSGRFDREVVEASVLDYAGGQGVDCTVAEERHLLNARLAFTASGPAFKLDAHRCVTPRASCCGRQGPGPADPYSSRMRRASSCANRSRSYARLDRLDPDAAREALEQPARAENVTFEDEALTHLVELSGAYPAFLQAYGREVWNTAPGSPITDEDVRAAEPVVQQTLDEQFFHVRFEKATPMERRYMSAMAELGDGPQQSGKVAIELGQRRPSGSSVHRDSLIKKGLIYSPAHGAVDFTVPQFAAFMRRRYPLGA